LNLSDLPSLIFPGPGTAALFGAALVFAALAWTGGDSSQTVKWAAFVGGVALLIVGALIELTPLHKKSR